MTGISWPKTVVKADNVRKFKKHLQVQVSKCSFVNLCGTRMITWLVMATALLHCFTPLVKLNSLHCI